MAFLLTSIPFLKSHHINGGDGGGGGSVFVFAATAYHIYYVTRNYFVCTRKCQMPGVNCTF